MVTDSGYEMGMKLLGTFSDWDGVFSSTFLLETEYSELSGNHILKIETSQVLSWMDGYIEQYHLTELQAHLVVYGSEK